MDREEIIRRFKNLNVWKRDGERAPHKPLLVLYAIGKLLRGEDRLISYADDIEDSFNNLLKKFRPRRDNHNPQFPFWRLQNDGIWDIPNANQIRQTSSGDAWVTDLKNYNVSGGFLEEISYEFQNDSNFALEISQYMLDHFRSSMHDDILQAVRIESPLPNPRIREQEGKFLEDVLKAYKYRCAICGFGIKLDGQLIALEATHIKSREASGPDAVENGLALCSLHYVLFDCGAFTLSDQLRVLVSKGAKGRSRGDKEQLHRFHGEKIKLPPQMYYPRINFIDWRMRKVFQGNYREIT